MMRGVYLCLCLLLTSCLDDFQTGKIKKVTLGPSIGLPLINSTFNFEDYLDATGNGKYLSVDSSGVYVFSYKKDNLLSTDISSYFEIEDKSTTESMSFTTAELAPLPIDFQVTKTQQYEIDFASDEGDLLDSLFLSSGQLAVNVTSTYPTSGSISFRFLSLSNNGAPIELTENWEYDGIIPALDYAETLDLSHLKVDLTDNGTSSNRFIFEVEVTLNYEQEPVQPSNSIDFHLELLGFEVSALFGQVAERSVDVVSDTLTLNFFNELQHQFVDLEDPRLYLRIGNSFGIPAELDLNYFISVSDDGDVPLTGEVLHANPISAPTIQQVGDTVYSEIQIDPFNSNIDQLFSGLPTKIEYELEGTLNPMGVSNENFALNTSNITVGMRMVVPLVGRVIQLRATEYYTFDGSNDLKELEEAELKVTTNNGMPFTMDLQINFLDSMGADILPLLTEENQRLLEGAQVDTNGDVVESSTAITRINLTAEDLVALNDARRIEVVTTYHTSNDGQKVIKVKPGQNLQVKVGIFAKIKAEL